MTMDVPFRVYIKKKDPYDKGPFSLFSSTAA